MRSLRTLPTRPIDMRTMLPRRVCGPTSTGSPMIWSRPTTVLHEGEESGRASAGRLTPNVACAIDFLERWTDGAEARSRRVSTSPMLGPPAPMTSDCYVLTQAIREAVKGQETTVLAALGIAWQDGAPHISCPYHDHSDGNPSWRWDERKAKAYCTCITSAAGTRSSTSSCMSRGWSSMPPSCGSPRSSGGTT